MGVQSVCVVRKCRGDKKVLIVSVQSNLLGGRRRECGDGGRGLAEKML